MKIKINKIKEKFKKIPRALAWHPFLSFWVVLLVSLVIGGVFFVKYVVLPEEPEESFKKTLRFKQGIYNEVLGQWE